MPSTKIGQKYGCSYMTITKILEDNTVQILDRRANLNLDKEYIITPSDSVLCTKCGKYKI